MWQLISKQGQAEASHVILLLAICSLGTVVFSQRTDLDLVWFGLAERLQIGSHIDIHNDIIIILVCHQ